jgi:hypothetical protein
MAALGAGLIALLVPVALRFSAVPAEPGHGADNERDEDGAPEPGDGTDPDAGRLSEPVAAPANLQRR